MYAQHHILKLIHDALYSLYISVFIIFHLMAIPQFSIHSTYNEHLNYSQFGVVTSNAIMNIFVHVCSLVYTFN